MIRETLSATERSWEIQHTIDPGFVNHRLVESVLGEGGTSLINELIARLPPMPDWVMRTRVNHVYTRVALDFCRVNGVPTLGELLSAGRGRIFCSTEQFGPCPRIYDKAERVSSECVPRGQHEMKIELHYSVSHISSDTLRSQLAEGEELSLIAVLHQRRGNTLEFHPLIIGGPWLHTEDPAWADKIVYWNHEYYENFIEDFDEFRKVTEIPKPTELAPMRLVSEKGFKACLSEILGDIPHPDWGGETSDHYTASLHLNGRRVTAAFLLKGPAKFAPMGLNHLGKNNDQIYRLAQEPADVLIVQHCHEILPPVRATLRAFAVQPSRPRRYSLLDGRDSLWLLQAYGLYDKALSL